MNRLTWLVVVVTLTACNAPAQTSAPGLTTTLTTTPTTNAATTNAATAHFTLAIPARTTTAAMRHAAFVSPSTLSGTITIAGVTTQLDLGPVACAAVANGRACTFSAAAPIGTDTVSLALYDGAFDTINHVHTGTLIGGGSNFSVVVAEGVANVSVPLVLGGIPTSFDVVASGLTGGTPATVPLALTAYDADGNTIVGAAPFVNASGATQALSLSLATSTTQVVLHNGAQSGATITVAGPTDAPTVALAAPATVLGAVLIATQGSTPVTAGASHGNIRVAGTYATTVVASGIVGSNADAAYYAPMGPRADGGPRMGFAMDWTYAGGSSAVGYFQTNPETIAMCTTTTTNLAITGAAGSTLAVAYTTGSGTNYSIPVPPWGVQTYAITALVNGAACPAPTYQYDTDVPGYDIAEALAYDPIAGSIYELDRGTFSGSNTLADDAFTGGSPPSGHTNIHTFGVTTRGQTMVQQGSARYFVEPGFPTRLWKQTGVALPTFRGVGGATFGKVTSAPDGFGWWLDTTAQKVYGWNGTTNPTIWTTPFSGTVTTGVSTLAIGADGAAYACEMNLPLGGAVEALTSQGASTVIALHDPSASHTCDALFDGQNGFLYAVDSWDGQIERISH